MKTPDAGQNIITRGLPKTGQETQYFAGDDGDYEAGWWRGRLNANNRERWIAKTIVGDDIVVDRATGLMWAADGNQGGCAFGLSSDWHNAIRYMADLIFADFTDWRLPNVFELASILRYRGVGPFIEQPPFSNTISNFYWSSTTEPTNIALAMIVSFADCQTRQGIKATNTFFVRAVRKGL